MNILGAYFEGANQPDFSDAEILYEIRECPNHPFTIHSVKSKKSYRYIRYCCAPEKSNRISELLFLDADHHILTGDIISNPGADLENVRKAFDNDKLSWYGMPASENLWIGMDFGQPTRITSVVYMARTDDNDICPGDLYELWYWDNEWQSMGKQVATGYSVTWKDVPSDALYWIRDLTHGVEQRIFTYENGHAVWW